MRRIEIMMKKVQRLTMVVLGLAAGAISIAQGPTVENASTYTLGGLTVLGADYTDAQAVKLFSALQIGQELNIPGEDVTRAIRNLWAQDLFSDISVELAEVRDNLAYVVIRVEELPRLTRYTFQG
jgi:outer membrane protein insertion porin family